MFDVHIESMVWFIEKLRRQLDVDYPSTELLCNVGEWLVQ